MTSLNPEKPIVPSHSVEQQRQAFVDHIGDRWLDFNRDDLGKLDPVSSLLEANFDFTPATRVLEVGCSNGWRLVRLRQRYGCQVAGIDPSVRAVSEAVCNGVSAQRGTADSLPWKEQTFDVVIYGFCLYAIPPGDLFSVVREGDRVLDHGGILVIDDYSNQPESFCRWLATKNPHWSFHCDFKQLWLAHPYYRRALEVFNDRCGRTVSVMIKTVANPLDSFKI